MRSVQFPAWLSNLVKKIRNEYPEAFVPFHYDEWDTFEEYGEELKRNYEEAKEAEKNGALKEFIKELRKRPSKAADKWKKR